MKHKAETEPEVSVWDGCRDALANETARRERIAAQYRGAAVELGALQTDKPGEWELRCPHCGVVTFVAEEGKVFTRGASPKTCPATDQITRRCKAAKY